MDKIQNKFFKRAPVNRGNLHGHLYWVVLFLTGLLLVNCGNPYQRASNHPSSNEEAQSSLGLRLQKTEEVRVQLNSIRDALRSLDSALMDLSKALNANPSLNGKPLDRFRNVTERLREVLMESTKGIVQYQPDGSWILERTIALPLGREDYSCKTSKIQILGQRIDDFDNLSVSLLDCSSTERLPLLNVKVYSDRMDAVFYPEILDQLTKQQPKREQCFVRIHTLGTEIHCDPIQIKADNFIALIDPLHFVHNSSGTDANVKLVVRDSGEKLIFSVELEAHPGMKSRISLQTKETMETRNDREAR